MKWNVERRSMKRLYIMKKLLAILVLGLLWCNVGFADDISEYQIEGISIGDSLLDHLSKLLFHHEENFDIDLLYVT